MADYVDNYCERVEPGFWGEPLNTVGNLSFLVAAVAAALLVRSAGRRPVELWPLPVMIFLIFVGSGLFHTTATRWGLAMDSASIALFMLYFVMLFPRLYWGTPWRLAWLGAPVLLGLTFVVGAVLRGAPGMYLAALTGMLVLAGLLYFSRQPDLRRHWSWYVIAAGVFAVSLTARTLDKPLCADIPVGTHFLWHTLNGLVLYLVTRAAVARWREVHTEGVNAQHPS